MIRRPEMKFKEVVIPRLRVLLSRQVPDLSRRSTIDLADACVESPHAAEAGSKRNLTHRQTRLVDELFRKVQTARVRHRHRRCPQVSQEQAPKMPRPNSEAFRKNFYATVLQTTLADKTQRSRNCVGSP